MRIRPVRRTAASKRPAIYPEVYGSVSPGTRRNPFSFIGRPQQHPRKRGTVPARLSSQIKPKNGLRTLYDVCSITSVTSCSFNPSRASLMKRPILSLAALVLLSFPADGGFDWNVITPDRESRNERQATSSSAGWRRTGRSRPAPAPCPGTGPGDPGRGRGEGFRHRSPGADFHVKFSSSRTLKQLENKRTRDLGMWG